MSPCPRPCCGHRCSRPCYRVVHRGQCIRMPIALAQHNAAAHPAPLRGIQPLTWILHSRVLYLALRSPPLRPQTWMEVPVMQPKFRKVIHVMAISAAAIALVPAPRAFADSTPPTATPIKHVIIVIGENHK